MKVMNRRAMSLLSRPILGTSMRNMVLKVSVTCEVAVQYSCHYMRNAAKARKPLNGHMVVYPRSRYIAPTHLDIVRSAHGLATQVMEAELGHPLRRLGHDNFAAPGLELAVEFDGILEGA